MRTAFRTSFSGIAADIGFSFGAFSVAWLCVNFFDFTAGIAYGGAVLLTIYFLFLDQTEKP